jgi:hypothetical protein
MPGWLVDKAIETAKQAVLSGINPETLHPARMKVLDFFGKYGVGQAQIEQERGRPIDQWTPRDIVDLRGMATALKEGRVSAAEIFGLQTADPLQAPSQAPPLQTTIAGEPQAVGQTPTSERRTPTEQPSPNPAAEQAVPEAAPESAKEPRTPSKSPPRRAHRRWNRTRRYSTRRPFQPKALPKSPQNPAPTGTANRNRSPSATICALTGKAARSGIEGQPSRILGLPSMTSQAAHWEQNSPNFKENPLPPPKGLHFFLYSVS